MKIAIISGSIRNGRMSHGVALALQQKLAEIPGIQPDLVDLATIAQPFGGAASVSTEELQQRVGAADAILIVSPEYHGTYSAALKHATELLGNAFRKKPTGVVSVSAGSLGGIRAALQLQHLILALFAYPIPQMLLVAAVQQKVSPAGAFTDPAFEQKTDEFLEEFVWFADAITRKKEFAA